MLDYEELFKEIDEEKKEKSLEEIYIENHKKFYNIEEPLLFLAEFILEYGFSGKEALETIDKYKYSLYSEFQLAYAYACIHSGKDILEKKENLIGLFDFLEKKHSEKTLILQNKVKKILNN